MREIGRLVLLIAVVSIGAFAEDDIEIHKLHFGVFNSLGVIDAKGDTVVSDGTTGEPIENQPYNRFGGWMSMGATINQRTDLFVVMAMMTWNSLPLTEDSPFTRMQSLGSNLGQANVSHKFGDLESPILTMKFGAFPFSYSNSKNLGGHLLTAGTYPGTLTSNFWQLIDGNSYNAQGLSAHFSFLESALNVDVNAFFEHGMEPNYNLSPSVIASYKVGDMIEFGAGVVFSHLLAWDDDVVTPKKRDNAFYQGKRLPASEWFKPGLEPKDTLIVPDGDLRAVGDSTVVDPRPDLVEKGIPVAYVEKSLNGIPKSQLEFYTFRGTKVMGRVALTPFSFAEELDKVTLFAEATLLGVKDYPFFYENKLERMPITIGLNLPLPMGLEVTADVEYYKNKFMNHIQKVYETVLPRWNEDESSFFVDSLDPILGAPVKNADGKTIPSDTVKTSHNNGNWFWSVTVKKEIMTRFNIKFKIAHDYLRLYNFFGNPSNEPTFRHDDGWYFVIKSEFSL